MRMMIRKMISRLQLCKHCQSKITNTYSIISDHRQRLFYVLNFWMQKENLPIFWRMLIDMVICISVRVIRISSVNGPAPEGCHPQTHEWFPHFYNECRNPNQLKYLNKYSILDMTHVEREIRETENIQLWGMV